MFTNYKNINNLYRSITIYDFGTATKATYKEIYNLMESPTDINRPTKFFFTFFITYTKNKNHTIIQTF